MITQEYVKTLLTYDETSGIFIWNERPQSFFKTKRAWSAWNTRYSKKHAGTLKDDSGYMILSLQKQLFRAHRLAWLYTHGVMPSNQIDHINGIRHDNRLINLRDTEQGQNHKNKRLLSTNKTGYHGVWLHSNGKYRAQVWDKNKKYHLGYFHNLEDAIKTRKKFEAEHDYHANHGVMTP